VPPIDGRTPGTISAWRSRVAPHFSREQWADFDAALQELRLQASTQGASGSEAQTEAVGRAIGGHTFNEVLRLGAEAKLARLEGIATELKRMVDANSVLIARPGSEEAAEVLDHRLRDQRDRLRAMIAEIDATRRQVVELGGTLPPAPALADSSAAPMSREDALREIHDLIFARRQAATTKYGTYPLRLVYSPKDVPDEERADFEARRAAATANGHSVIAVRVKDRWYIYDAAVEYPRFSPNVTASLTDEDQTRVKQQWAQVEAEIWARRQHAAEVHPELDH
jgi:hypothetical protein